MSAIAEPSPQSEHVSILSLWRYRTRQGTLPVTALMHIGGCTECLLALRACQAVNSLEEAERVLRNVELDRAS
jgi:hypothetical protein